MEFLVEYGLFFAKAITVVIAVIIIFSSVLALAAKNKPHGTITGQIDVKKINDRFDEYENQIKHIVLSEEDYKAEEKKQKKTAKAEKKEKDKTAKPRIFLLNFEGDVKASEVDKLRQEVNAVLTVANKKDEVVINIESPGGMVHTYGLAASQLQRIRAEGVPLTVCVDKVAASGGYLMACVGDKILSAPFAIIGSIGVLAQIPNFNKVLKKYDVDYEQMTAGEYKAPITMFGEITDKGRGKLKEELEETHQLFKGFITEHRPQVPIDEVATGEVWYGQKAIDHNLVDEVVTSDSYLMRNRKEKDIFEISFVEKKTIQEKLGLAIHHGISGGINSLLKREYEANITK